MTRPSSMALVTAVFSLATGWASADVTLLTQSFDSMGSSGTSPPSGWTVGYFNPAKNRDLAGGDGGIITPASLIVDNGSGVGDASYNYGTTGAGDRAIGNVPKTGTGDRIIQAAITNNTGLALTSITLSYWGEQWHRGESKADSGTEMIRLYYSAVSATAGFVSMGSALQFIAPQNLPGQPQAALDGNAAANRTYTTGTYTPAAPIANGATFYIRWYDWNDNNTVDHGLAIDDVNVTGAPVAGLVVYTLGATDVQQNSATLNGSISDLGGEPQAQVWFQWGTSPANLDQTTTPQTVTVWGPFSTPLTGLTPETVYYYKAAAAAGSRTGEGMVRSFFWTSNYGFQFDGANSHVTMGPAPGLGSATFTIETWFKRTGTGQTASSGSGGVAAVPLVCKGVGEGDGSNIDANYFFGIRSSDNVLAADFEDMASGLNHPIAGSAPIANDVWYHAAVSYDGTIWRLYLNGMLDAELAVGATPRYDSIQHFGLGTALNSTGLQSGRFAGVLDEVRVWNYARSLAEIRTVINTEISSSATGLLGRWGLNEGSGTVANDSSGHGNNGTIIVGTWAFGSPFNANIPPEVPILVAPADGSTQTEVSLPLTVHVSDYEADTLEVKFYGRQLSSAPRPPFSMIAVPDTQNYSMSYPATFTAQTQWIVNNRQTLNIAYVGHEGDIVNNSDQPTQWTNANTSISIFDTAPELPFGLCIGNHDENPPYNPSGTAEFNSYFGVNYPGGNRYQSRPWYGGHYGTDNDNHYILFSAGGMDFIAIHFEYDDARPQAVFDWAGNLLQTHSNRRAIVVAHNMLNVGTPAPWTSQGSAIYSALRGYPNLFLMMCGHNHGEGMRTEFYQNRTVYVLLADYQSRNAGGDGWLRILQFWPDDNQIDVTTYSPTLGQYERDADSEFTLEYGMGGAPYVELGTVTAASDSDASFTWASLEPERTYEWYVTVSDGHSTIAGPAWWFDVDRPPTPEIALAPTSIDRSVNALSNLPNDSFTVTNVGPGTMTYTITDDADWLSVEPAGGDSGGEADTIQIVYDVAGLPAGTHTATITVSSGDAWNSPEHVSVTVHVLTVKPDFDGDGDVDQSDFGHQQACLTTSGIEPGCENADLDGGDTIGQGDIAAFLGCMRGANTAADPNCD